MVPDDAGRVSKLYQGAYQVLPLSWLSRGILHLCGQLEASKKQNPYF